MLVRFVVTIAVVLATVDLYAATGDIVVEKPTAVCPGTRFDDRDTQAAYDSMWRNYLEGMDRITGAVSDEFTRLHDEAQGDGNLALTLFWKELRESFDANGTLTWDMANQRRDWKRFGDAKFPGDLAGFLRQRVNDYNEAKANLEKGYKEMEIALTKAKKLDLAMSVRAEAQGLWPSPVVRNSIGIELRLIKPGKFMMGCADRQSGSAPLHQVRITKPYYMGVHEVTNAQWKAVMPTLPSKHTDGDVPVEQVTWHEAVAFCQALSALPGEKAAQRSYRLPTEAEWEYACRAGTATRYSFGNDDTGMADHGWFKGNADAHTHAVGKKKPNAWGLHDMHGNVWEWVSDWHGTYPSGPVVDPRGASEGPNRVIRGGAWYRLATECRSASREAWSPTAPNHGVGFRLVLEAFAPAAPPSSE